MRWPWARRSTCAAQQEATQLCSIHQSKGKEWRAVFLAGAEEGFVPHHHALQDDDALDGELRLLYVALTRVRERLYVSYCRQRERGGRARVSAAVTLAVRPATRAADARRLAGVAVQATPVASAIGRIDTSALKLAHPIEDVVARYGIELRRQGHALVGRCPFHADGGRPNLHIFNGTQTLVLFQMRHWAATS